MAYNSTRFELQYLESCSEQCFNKSLVHTQLLESLFIHLVPFSMASTQNIEVGLVGPLAQKMGAS